MLSNYLGDNDWTVRALLRPALTIRGDHGHLEFDNDHIFRRLDGLRQELQAPEKSIKLFDLMSDSSSFAANDFRDLKTLKEGVEHKSLPLHYLRMIGDPSTKIAMSLGNSTLKKAVETVNNLDDLALLRQNWGVGRT